MLTANKDDTISELKSSAKNLRNTANEAAEETAQDLRDAAHTAGRKVRAFIHSAGDEFGHAKETVETQIRSHPLQSGMIALGIGFVLGALFRR